MERTLTEAIALATLASMGDNEENGKRLERYVHTRWDRDRGGMRGLAREAEISADALYKWFRGDAEPTLAGLGRLAAVLKVKRHELVAVYDGDSPIVDASALLDPEARGLLVEMVASQVERALRQSRD
jgi:DNA-binding phage protein